MVSFFARQTDNFLLLYTKSDNIDHLLDLDPRGQTLDALVSSGCTVNGAAILRSVLFTNCSVERGSLVEDSIVLPSVQIGRHVRLRRAIVDKFCLLPDGFEAGVDRAADEARFRVTRQGVVLITPEMLGQNMHQYR
jgi:glucose-1-phosphate adenylyltransferase